MENLMILDENGEMGEEKWGRGRNGYWKAKWARPFTLQSCGQPHIAKQSDGSPGLGFPDFLVLDDFMRHWGTHGVMGNKGSFSLRSSLYCGGTLMDQVMNLQFYYIKQIGYCGFFLARLECPITIML
ncbi:hypothetical protein POM88_007708 [Heracleum sosnowskyi]|uniref:Uncharacterized protein n=1 Tax=Heracleum sosnowskyi TaxID=360622 RepID=A0AAD8N139_9APIA|nr:hypothetical protein POM88_007708 [Heracleum sosnowskyi]